MKGSALSLPLLSGGFLNGKTVRQSCEPGALCARPFCVRACWRARGRLSGGSSLLTFFLRERAQRYRDDTRRKNKESVPHATPLLNQSGG